MDIFHPNLLVNVSIAFSLILQNQYYTIEISEENSAVLDYKLVNTSSYILFINNFCCLFIEILQILVKVNL